MALRLAIVCVALVGLVACGDDDSPVITFPDGGGTDSGTGGGTDAGRTDSGTPDTCPPGTGRAPTGNVCAAATATCIEAATTQEAYEACIDGDPMADNCGACISSELIATCSATGVCDNEFGEIGCCLNDECASAADQNACVEAALGTGGACEGQWNAFVTCANTAANGGRCGNTDLCFMAAATFAPSFDARSFPFFPELLTAARGAQCGALLQ
ncbi:hypothetical protein [Sandaracinus amylolyticus]|uniref:hypothetical protein n=1 Tax=Sandaracinus amylolyticus TaxID=927083 RepID=UPI001F2D0E41|nr:hypothetical protein [Sandaracinus amylolyticus]